VAARRGLRAGVMAGGRVRLSRSGVQRRGRRGRPLWHVEEKAGRWPWRGRRGGGSAAALLLGDARRGGCTRAQGERDRGEVPAAAVSACGGAVMAGRRSGGRVVARRGKAVRRVRASGAERGSELVHAAAPRAARAAVRVRVHEARRAAGLGGARRGGGGRGAGALARARRRRVGRACAARCASVRVRAGSGWSASWLPWRGGVAAREGRGRPEREQGVRGGAGQARRGRKRGRREGREEKKEKEKG